MDSANIYDSRPGAKNGARSLNEPGRYSPCPHGAYGQSVRKWHIDQLVSGMQAGWNVLIVKTS